MHTTPGTDRTSFVHSAMEGWGALPRPPEQSVIGDTDGTNVIASAVHRVVEALIDFFEGDSPQMLPAAQAETIHEGFMGVVNIFGPNAKALHGGFTGALHQDNRVSTAACLLSRTCICAMSLRSVLKSPLSGLVSS